ncbi:hypothetical protein [Bacillus paramycoides]|uniref:hypothetical protein n=1 Tax=Bacillus paramycoides TaxID=2026194 RepID=UPI002E205DAF|nr:hypothetical protein [Bacillus paramycoides]
MAFQFRLSSGPFYLPPNAAAVDWVVLNRGILRENFQIAIFRLVMGARKVLIPGGIGSFILDFDESMHKTNFVGTEGQPFIPGFSYEVVVESDNLDVLPSVHVWSGFSGDTYIAGTRIGPTDFKLTTSGIWQPVNP